MNGMYSRIRVTAMTEKCAESEIKLSLVKSNSDVFSNMFTVKSIRIAIIQLGIVSCPNCSEVHELKDYSSHKYSKCVKFRCT